MKTIYFAGGCFWGAEKVFKALPGVAETTVGYANGHTDAPTYQEVCTDTTGHRETVQVVYDPEAIGLETLLRAFFLVIDPEVRDRQGGDVGTQYQTGVYYADDADRPSIERVFAEERAAHEQFFTELAPLRCFYPAEEYHQDYLDKNPGGYCHVTREEMAEIEALAASLRRYRELSRQLAALMEEEPWCIPVMANAAALLRESLPDLNWAGFYLMRGGRLVLGPFQGKIACIHIPVGRGVCGAAVREDRIQRVADVHAFPDHIACDSASRSEIVLPIHAGGAVAAVLDLDSPLPDRFSAADEAGLAAFVRTLEARIRFE